MFNLLSDDAKMLWLYILTCPHGNLLGFFVLKPGYVCEDLKWLPERFSKPFKELLTVPLSNSQEKGLISFDQKTNLLLIKNYLEHNPLANPNQIKAALNKLEELPFSPLFREFKQLLERFNKPLYKPLIEWLDKRLGKPVTVTETETEYNNVTSLAPKEPNTYSESIASKVSYSCIGREVTCPQASLEDVSTAHSHSQKETSFNPSDDGNRLFYLLPEIRLKHVIG